jgi:E3 ubiquitin-protein ligase MARCH6
VVIVPPPQGLAAGAGQLLRRNAENVAAQLERQAARLEAHVEQMFDAVEDADGAEDVPFDELVGMQGPVFHLVENAITVCGSPCCSSTAVPFSVSQIVIDQL